MFFDMLPFILKILNIILVTICAYVAAVAGWEFIHLPDKGWWPGFLAIIMVFNAYNYWTDLDKS